MNSMREYECMIRNSPIIGLKVKKTGEEYRRGDNPFYDAALDNYICGPVNVHNWYGFIRDIYDPIYE